MYHHLSVTQNALREELKLDSADSKVRKNLAKATKLAMEISPRAKREAGIPRRRPTRTSRKHWQDSRLERITRNRKHS